MLTSNVEIEPNRVWAICKLICSDKYTKNEVINSFSVNDESDRIISVLNFCEKIGLFKTNKNEDLIEPLDCVFEESIIMNKDQFAIKLSQLLLKQDEKMLNIISELISNFDQRYYQADSYQSILNKLPEHLVSDYNIDYIRVLRFWIYFFKIGYYNKKQIIIYPYCRLKNILESINFTQERIPIDDFLSSIKEKALEFKNQIDKNRNTLSYIFSTVLLDLEKDGYLKLQYIGDAQIYYSLTGNIIEKKSRVSHILIER